MERILNAHFKSQDAPTSSYYDPNDPESYENYLHMLMDDAADYENSILAMDRSNAQMYYYGIEPFLGQYGINGPYIGEDPTATLGEILDKDNENASNRSTFVSTDVRDAVMLVLPSLIRLFGASESPVYLVPRSEDEVDIAEQATDYVNYVFWNDNAGFLTLYGAFKDAMTVKTGFVKWWCDDHKERKRKTYVNVTAEQLQMILSEDPSARILEIGHPVQQASPMGAPSLQSPSAPQAPVGEGGPPPSLSPGPMGGAPAGAGPPNAAAPSPGVPMGPMAGAPPPPLPANLIAPPPPVYDKAVIEFEVSKPLIRVAGVPPEEMRLDRYARTFRDSRIVGHERIVPVDQLIAMGYDRDTCLDNIQSSESTFTMEPQLRNPGRFMGTRMGDGVRYGEWYVKVDKDGDGSPELRYICTMGDNHTIVHDEEANRIKFALFSVDPVSHTIVGDSLADYTEDIQRIKTNMMRSVLDSAAESINPKTVVNELMVTIDDALNDDLGAVIRTRGDPSSSVMFANIPFLGQAMMPVVEMLNDVLARRTGLTDAAKGLDPKALQSSTQMGVEAVINGAQERIELIARVLCETGFRDLFNGLYNEVCENQNQQRTLKIRGKFVPYDTGAFDASMAIEVNANLGKGSDMVRLVALNQIKQDQLQVVTTYGLNNPVCGIPEMLNTITDMLALANVKNVGRYFKTPNPQQMQQILAQPQKPDPMAVAAQAELEKVRTEAAKNVAQTGFNQAKLAKETQFKYDQLHAKTAYDHAKLQVDAQRSGVDPSQVEQAMQLEHAQAQHKMNLDQQKSQNAIALDQQKAASDMQLAREKNHSDMAARFIQMGSEHHLAQQRVDNEHEAGMAAVKSKHVLGALASRGDET